MTAPIRIAQVMGKMVGGGVETVVMNYYRHIDRSRVQFDLLVDSDSTLVPRAEVEALGGRVIEVPPYQQLPRYIHELEHLFHEERWPIVHSHINSLSVFPLYAAKQAGIPIRIAHSHNTSGKGEPIRSAMKHVLRPLANLYPTHRLACSSCAGKWLFGKSTSFNVLQNAFDAGSFHFDPIARKRMRASLGIQAGTFVFGHAGRFSPQKNQAWLIRRFASLIENRTDIVLVLAGDGPNRIKCERLASKLDIPFNVIFAGQVSNMPAFYSAMDCFLIPSTYEGLGLVAVEAQLAGLPCIVSCNVPSEVNPAGEVIFAPLDNAQLWESLMRTSELRANRFLTQLELNAFNSFDITAWAPRLTGYYETLAASEHGEEVSL